jgi:HAD superfamily hydrolase (TIGR01509 family)
MKEFNKVPTLDQLLEGHGPIEAIIFDMDGTFLNSEPLHALAGIQLLKNHGTAKTSEICYKTFEERFRGLPLETVFKHLVEEELVQEAMDLEQFQISYEQLLLENIPQVRVHDLFDPKLAELMGMAHDLGLKTALCTASERRFTNNILEYFNFLHLFHVIKTNEDFARSKPDPLPYHGTMEALGLSAHQVLIVEDSIPGLTAAKLSGARFVKASWY